MLVRGRGPLEEAESLGDPLSGQGPVSDVGVADGSQTGGSSRLQAAIDALSGSAEVIVCGIA